MMVNGVLWAAGVEIPAEGASCRADADFIRKHLTPRQSKQRPAKKPAQAKP